MPIKAARTLINVQRTVFGAVKSTADQGTHRRFCGTLRAVTQLPFAEPSDI
jgi:hypothetical protein